MKWLKIAALILALASYAFPLWTTYLRAPIFGDRTTLHISITFRGVLDAEPEAIQNLNIGHHYVGLPPLHPEEMVELKLTPALPAIIIVTIALNALGKLRTRYAILIGVLTLGGFIAYFQWWLYNLGHSTKPGAPVKIEPFTPMVMGSYTVANFHATNFLDVGFWLLVASLILTYLGDKF